MLIDISKGTSGAVNIQMDDESCTYLEVEKLNEGLFQRIEQLKQNEDWRYGYIDQELYNELIESCGIETCCSGSLNFGGENFSFELYDEALNDGLYLVYRTEDIAISAVL